MLTYQLEIMGNDKMDELSQEALKTLKEIKKTWDTLQKEPYGNYATDTVYLPPSSASYVHNAEEMEKYIGKLCDETSNRFSMELEHLSHTVNKEVEYVKQHHADSRKSREKNNAVLSGLMRDANEQIERDIYSILRLTENL